MSQLNFDGDLVPVVNVPRRAHRAPLSSGQREILERVRSEGSIRSVEAGVILAAGRSWKLRYAATDGSEAMKRLAARGLVQRDPAKAGRWLAT